MPLIQQDSPSLANLARDFAWGRKFIIWIGSGLSVPAGLPSWAQLRARLENRLSAAAKRKLPDLDAAASADLIAHIRRLPSPWEAFEALRSRLGASEYRQVVELALNDGEIPTPPVSLMRIWSNPNVDGVISLNLDSLASRAFAEVNGGRRELSRATGVTLNLGLRYLAAYQPFLVQLHGRLDDEGTWIFTESDLINLFDRHDYNTFVRSALTARRVLFIGCSPDDVAVSRHFEELGKISANMPDHYWFVPAHEVDAARDANLARMGINIVEYLVRSDGTTSEKNEDHITSINQLFDYLEDYQYREVDPDPINPMAGPSGAQLPPERVQALAPEQARNVLSRYATAILESTEPNRSGRYQKFIQDYGAAIAVASYVPRGVGVSVFGHHVDQEIGSGAFSRVLKATAPDGITNRAIKLVRSEVRDDPVMLRSFRRGVRSMQILSEKNVDGMVAYDQAYEIPPCVIMPYIDGDNLETLALRPTFSLELDGFQILAEVAEIVHAAHNLNERVLHRDLRPSNIMVRRSEGVRDIRDRVVVLDFDLSWHEGADTDSPISPNMTTVLGYLAPEQIANDLSVSARHSKVDTFGLCMTLYYIVQKQHPDFRARASSEWPSIRNRIGIFASGGFSWKSMITRIRRLIDNGTEPDQAMRMDFDVAKREMNILAYLVGKRISDIRPESQEFLPLDAVAEEIFAVGLSAENYAWEYTSARGRYGGALGVTIEIGVSTSHGQRGIHIRAIRQFDGTQSFSTVRKYWHEHQNEIVGTMRRGGWTGGTTTSASNQEISMEFFASEAVSWRNPVGLAGAVAEAWRRLNLS